MKLDIIGHVCMLATQEFTKSEINSCMLDVLSTLDWCRFFFQAAHYMSRATEAIDGPCNDCDEAGSAMETGGAAGDISIGAITKALANKLRHMKQVPFSAGPYIKQHQSIRKKFPTRSLYLCKHLCLYVYVHIPTQCHIIFAQMPFVRMFIPVWCTHAPRHTFKPQQSTSWQQYQINPIWVFLYLVSFNRCKISNITLIYAITTHDFNFHRNTTD